MCNRAAVAKAMESCSFSSLGCQKCWSVGRMRKVFFILSREVAQENQKNAPKNIYVFSCVSELRSLNMHSVVLYRMLGAWTYISELPTRVWEMRVASYEFIRICVVHVYACVRLHSIFRVAQTRCLHCLICILKCVFWQLIVTVWNCVLVLFDRTENTHLTSHCTAVVS